MSKILKATHDGKIEIGDLIIEASVLEDGTRVLSYRGVSKALGKGEKWSSNGVSKLPPFLAPKALEPFISAKISAGVFQPIEFKPLHGGRTAYGVPATLLPEICDVWLKAREARALKSQRYQDVAARAEILVRGFAHIGIIALVDEATGYQETRNRAELQTILSAYIAKELLPWALRFPEDFYKEMFRLWGWVYNASSKQKKPMLAGKITKELIYDRLPGDVIEEIKKINPKKTEGSRKGLHENHHHRYLTKEIGQPHLDKLVASVTTLMRISRNKRKFMEVYNQAFKPQQQLPLDLEEKD